MTGLRPLLESSDDELELALLRAVSSELPSASSMRQAAVALGVAVPTLTVLAASLPATSSLATSAASVAGGAGGAGVAAGLATNTATTGVVVGATSLGVLGKSLVGGALVSFLAFSAIDQTLRVVTTRSQPPAVLTGVAAPVAPLANLPEKQPASGALALADEVRPLVEELPPAAPSNARVWTRVSEHERAEPRPPSALAPAQAEFAAEQVPPSSTPPRSGPDSLAADIRMLDSTRAALAAGNTDGAAKLLDAYAAQRHSPTLAQEAALLRVQLFLKRGQHPLAVEQARRIIAQHPESAHVDWLRRLAAEP